MQCVHYNIIILIYFLLSVYDYRLVRFSIYFYTYVRYQPLQSICDTNCSTHVINDCSSIWAMHIVESCIHGLLGINLLKLLPNFPNICVYIAYQYNWLFYMWWDIRHHGRWCWDYLMETYTECRQSLLDFRPVSWCCDR